MTLLAHSALLPLWVLVCVGLLERYWVWPEKFHPLTLFRLLAINLARKVHPSTERSVHQQRLSGTLAIVVLLLPVLVLLAILVSLAEFPLFFDGLILLIALHYQPMAQRFDKVATALAREKKVLARDLLQPMVLRETAQLSPLGIAKGAIESLLLRFNYQYGCVIFWFLLTGAVGALGYRLVFELSQCWNSKQPRFKVFGRPAGWICTVMQFIPARIIAWSFAMSMSVGGAIKSFRQRPRGSHSHTTLLAILGGAMGIQLGGPAYYTGLKVRFSKVGGPRELRFADLERTRSALFRTRAILFTLVILLSAISYALAKGIPQ